MFGLGNIGKLDTIDGHAIHTLPDAELSVLLGTPAKSRVFDRGDGMKQHVTHVEASAHNSKSITLWILPQLSGGIDNWVDFVRRRVSEGYDVIFQDLRDQGRSARAQPEQPQIHHIHEFADYGADMNYVYDCLIAPLLQRRRHKLVALGASLGGKIFQRFLPDSPSVRTDLLVLLAPMTHALAFDKPGAGIVPWVMRWVGFANDYVPTRGDFDPVKDLRQAANLATDVGLYEKAWTTVWQNKPHLIKGAPSNLWVTKNMIAEEVLQKRALDLTVPVLAFCPRNDRVVSTRATKYWARCVRRGRTVIVPGKHEDLQLTPVLDPWFAGLPELLATLQQPPRRNRWGRKVDALRSFTPT